MYKKTTIKTNKFEISDVFKHSDIFADNIDVSKITLLKSNVFNNQFIIVCKVLSRILFASFN